VGVTKKIVINLVPVHFQADLAEMLPIKQGKILL